MGSWTQNFFSALTDRESAVSRTRDKAWTRIMPLDFDRSPKSDLGYSGWVQFTDGEIYVKDLQGDVSFRVWYRPDYDETWHLWRSWTVSSGATYKPRMGFGEPPAEEIQGNIEEHSRDPGRATARLLSTQSLLQIAVRL